MSTLQISLAIIGLLVLALVVAYNIWNARRNTPKRIKTAAMDSWSEALRQEPALDDRQAQAQAHVPPPAAATDLAPQVRLDAQIDAIAPVQVQRMVDGAAALLAQPPARRAGQKPFAIEGMNAETRQWEPVQPAQRYTGFQAGVQLVNRSGALTELEFSEFAAHVQQFADVLGALAQLPDMAEEVARARELDAFASAHDMQITLTLLPRQAAWSARYVRQSAQALGFGAAPQHGGGHMHLPQTGADAEAETGAADAAPHDATTGPLEPLAPLLRLHYYTNANAAAGEGDGADAAGADGVHDALDDENAVINVLHLALDVPQVPEQAQPFEALRHMAEQLCQHMDAALCDQYGQVLPPEHDWQPERERLQDLYRQLDEQGLRAGSPRALRVFG